MSLELKDVVAGDSSDLYIRPAGSRPAREVLHVETARDVQVTMGQGVSE